LALRRDPLSFFTRIARDHGDVAFFTTVGRRYVLLSHPEHIREILVTQAGKFTKGPALRQAKVTLGEGLLTSEGDFHRRQRRLAQPAFHPHRVQGYADAMVRFARQATDGWDAASRDGLTIDVHAEMAALTLRIVADALFGAEVGPADVARISRAMTISVTMFARARSPFAPILNRLPLPSNYRYLAAYRHLAGTIDGFIARRRADHAATAGRADLLSILLRSHDVEGDGSGMSDRQLRDECYTLFTAGHETTANALTFTWDLLARHHEVEAKLHAELDAVLAGRPPSAGDVERLPYARAVVAESMRLYPPAWVLARQCREAWALPAVDAGSRADGHVLAEGTVVLMSQWVTQRDPRWWHEPGKFDPSRWLPGPGGAEVNRPRYAYFPFGGGPRQCIGEAFAWAETVLVLAAIAQRWRLRLPEPKWPLQLQPTITLRPKGPLPMRPESRGALQA
jgi:cytochrome P450